jgi:hypothetical protein
LPDLNSELQKSKLIIEKISNDHNCVYTKNATTEQNTITDLDISNGQLGI